MLNKLEIRSGKQMLDVTLRSRKQVVEGDDLVSRGEQPIAEFDALLEPAVEAPPGFGPAFAPLRRAKLRRTESAQSPLWLVADA